MTPTALLRPRRRTGAGNLGLLALFAAFAGVTGWLVWSKQQYDADLERRWALPHEARTIAEEEISLTPRSVGELAEDEVKAALARYDLANEGIRVRLSCRHASGQLSEADRATELERGTTAARARFDAEADAATEQARRLVRELEARNAERRLQLHRKALDLVAEWDRLFARHPEWPAHRLTAEE